MVSQKRKEKKKSVYTKVYLFAMKYNFYFLQSFMIYPSWLLIFHVLSVTHEQVYPANAITAPSSNTRKEKKKKKKAHGSCLIIIAFG